jgi:chromosome segregation ATPase
MQRLKAKN